LDDDRERVAGTVENTHSPVEGLVERGARPVIALSVHSESNLDSVVRGVRESVRMEDFEPISANSVDGRVSEDAATDR
jgi:hypothetical protein